MADPIAKLESVLHLLADVSAEGAPSVVKIDSGTSGPSAAIVACTHGNEPVGLAAIQYLLSDLILRRGSLYFIIGNPKAAECYFSATCNIGKEDSRYIDKNLNRLPKKDKLTGSTEYEFQRAAELLPILEEVDGVLDLHSTSSDAPPMLICVDDASTRLVQDSLFPFEHVITNIQNHMSDQFLIEYCTQARLRILAECGQHESLDASQRAIDISLAFLHRMGLVEDFAPPERKRQVNYYHAKQAIFLPKDCGEFRLRQMIHPFEYIEKDQDLACNGSDTVTSSPDSGYAIMAPETTNTLDCNEALLFLCDRAEVPFLTNS